MTTKHTPGECANCGAGYGLHHFETMQCPKNGIEEFREGKKQEWELTTFENKQWTKAREAAPELLEALKQIMQSEPLPKHLSDYAEYAIQKAEQ